MPETPFAGRVEAVRRFSRFYTCKIGLLHQRAYRSPFSLTEVRVLYELAHRDRLTAAHLVADLGLDPGYLSRILTGFERQGLLQKQRSRSDGRQLLLSLSPRGWKAFRPLDRRSAAEVGAILRPLSPSGQRRIVEAMGTVESMLGGRATTNRNPRVHLRAPRPGDLGWVVERHGALYAAEYGYNEEFEALVAEIVAKFVQQIDRRRERCWIAEKEGEPAGSVFLVKKSKTVAKLRLLLVEPSARGLGIGSRLVEECISFARKAGYRTITLWTQSELLAARRIYQRAGFECVARHPHRSFGKKLVAETWRRNL